MEEALEVFGKAAAAIDSWQSWRSGRYNQALLKILDGRNAVDHLNVCRRAILEETLPGQSL